MSILDMNKRRALRRPAVAYAVVSLLCIVITNIYALFGHGVRSDFMDFMFLYPLAGGGIWLLLRAICFGKAECRPLRIGVNLYHSGIATLTAGSMLNGIMEIAGASSKNVKFFDLFGWGFVFTGTASILVGYVRHGKMKVKQANDCAERQYDP